MSAASSPDASAREHITSSLPSNSVTGRDEYIIAKALAYAITTIDNLPHSRQEGGDRDDMETLLAVLKPHPEGVAEAMRSARAHMGHEPFFTPSDGFVAPSFVKA